MIIPDEKLKDLLLKSGTVDEPTWERAEQDAKRLGQGVADILISERYISEDYYLNLISSYTNIPRVRLKILTIPQSVLRIVPQDLATLRRVIPFALEGNILRVAMVNPQDLETVRYLESATNKKIEPYLTSLNEFKAAISSYQKASTENLSQLIEAESRKLALKPSQTLDVIAKELSTVAIVDNLINFAVSLDASDIHIEALSDSLLIRFRVDGVLKEIMRLPKETQPIMIARVKIMSGLQIDEHQRAQDGRFKFKFSEEEFDIRVSIMPTLYGEKAVLRILALLSRPSTFEELGMNDQSTKILNENIKKTFGMILATGPTGSGKTTTLYTILGQLNKPGVNICTIEDPIEYEMRYVNQIQVNERAGIDFSNGLRSILRQDPNIIMVGEIRDVPTGAISIQAALTGHILLSTLHTNDSVGAVPRLIDMQVPPFLISATLNAVVAQRLVRRICLDCIYSQNITPAQEQLIYDEIKIHGLKPEETRSLRVPKIIFKGKGCKSCSFSGYRGRIGIFEILNLTNEIKNYIYQKDFTLDGLKTLARKNGLRTMFEDGLEKIGLGITTIEEVLRVIRE